MSATWNPATYLHYADERSRPFTELLARVPTEPATIADLGCGPGHLSGLLRARWPHARIDALDSSPEMIERARAEHQAPGVHYHLGDLRTWRPPAPVDLLISNATFQWVPGHLNLLGDLTEHISDQGTLAFSVPGNFDGPSHRLLRSLARSDPYAAHTENVTFPHAHDPGVYLDALATLGWRVDAWETTYLHTLTGPDPVLTWISATGAREVLAALPPHLLERFRAEYGAALRQAYPETEHGTVLPFRRIFVVARRPGRTDPAAQPAPSSPRSAT
ncbi:methyltransferase domain-containing protein [Pseudactinotalea sp. Z1748]|uniref:methyltransferase domain-containing protein n=1 Tax=Pseudactinotalea sp. Z1748 TaxID=3413027 RepID=UPI003C79B0D9